MYWSEIKNHEKKHWQSFKSGKRNKSRFYEVPSQLELSSEGLNESQDAQNDEIGDNESIQWLEEDLCLAMNEMTSSATAVNSISL